MTLPSWLERGLADLFPHAADHRNQTLSARLAAARQANRPLRVKLGIDPTGSSIHLGHTILYRKLRAFQDAGHTAVVILGDFTARIGDPTGKSATRPRLSVQEVEENARTYLEQLRPILDFVTPGRLEIQRNSTWLAKLDLTQVIGLLATTTVGQMLAKEDFAQRYGQGTPIALHEFLYPLLQGYDSVMVKADVELGGTDQKFNVAMGRDLQRHFGQPPQFGLLMPILTGMDGGQKMSKSLGNTIGLQEDPLTTYSKLEKVADAVVDDYITLLTDLDPAAVPRDPRQRQKAMALAVTASLHGREAAQRAQAAAATLVMTPQSSAAEAQVPEARLASIWDWSTPIPAYQLLHAIFRTRAGVNSTSEARRRIQGGALRLDGEKVMDPQAAFAKENLEGKVLQLGKKTFCRLVD
ncbi:MAG: tyrosyl-tRNA synthetase [Candidatus Synechococcus spongiarum SP3]|uniref:Tyrosine--tRNA ligase n=1 Tax=Candidatus Synechococcus spongiarum SP3 TaxID=1604020 RepID=A0A0G2IVG4_9SYNE|nr:MAG: tyrosyl-tRNA synthetase [Candidatus Synechococcus spongiarum SP3]